MIRRKIQLIGAVASCGVIAFGLILGNIVSATVPGVNEAVGASSLGGAPNGEASNGMSISQNGRYVAFASTATDLTSGSTLSGTYPEVYVRDRLSHTTSIVSISGSGSPADGASGYVRISSTGRYVVFASTADNLTTGTFPSPSSGLYHIFIHDLETGTTQVADTDSSGSVNANVSSIFPDVSASGRYVVFQSYSSTSSNLVGTPTLVAYTSYIFEKDMNTGEISLISEGTSTTAPNSSSYSPRIDCAGDKVAFQSGATNLVSGDTNGSTDVFLRDMLSGTMTDTTVSGNDGSYTGAISCNGEYVGVLSSATNLNSDTVNNGQLNGFVYNDIDSTFTTVSKSSSGSLANNTTQSMDVSDDGRYVVFESSSTNLVSGITSGIAGIYLRNVESGTTELVSVDSSGSEGNGASHGPAISADGRYVAYSSAASNLVSGYSLSGHNLAFVSQTGTSDEY